MPSVRILRVVEQHDGRYGVCYRAQRLRLLLGFIPIWRDLYYTQYVGVDAETVPTRYLSAQDAEKAIADWVDNRGPCITVYRRYTA